MRDRSGTDNRVRFDPASGLTELERRLALRITELEAQRNAALALTKHNLYVSSISLKRALGMWD